MLGESRENIFSKKKKQFFINLDNDIFSQEFEFLTTLYLRELSVNRIKIYFLDLYNFLPNDQESELDH